MTAGVVWVALGGIITAAAVLVATRFGLTGAEPAALVGLVPIIGAACLWHWRREPLRAIAALAVTGLAFTGLAVGPAAAWISSANQLPGLVEAAHRHAGGHARLGTFTQITPNVVYYAHGHVQSWQRTDTAAALEFLASGADAVLLVRDDDFDALSAGLPDGVGIIGRSRPLFHAREFLLVGTASRTADRTASLGSKTQ